MLVFDRQTGQRLWQQALPSDSSENTSFDQRATPTPATDGDRVFALSGAFGLASLTMSGSPGWAVKMRPWPHHMGVGGSPVIHGDRLLVNMETDGLSYLYSIDRMNGRVVWRAPRRTTQAAYLERARRQRRHGSETFGRGRREHASRSRLRRIAGDQSCHSGGMVFVRSNAGLLAFDTK